MNQFIVLIADTLHVAGENVCFSDTIIFKVISPHNASFESINWTMVIITALIAVVLLAWIILYYRFQKEKLSEETKRSEDQHKWDVKNEEGTLCYKYCDKLLQLVEDNAVKNNL